MHICIWWIIKVVKIAMKNNFSNMNNVTITKSTFTNHYFQFTRAGFMCWDSTCMLSMYTNMYCSLDPYKSLYYTALLFLQVSDKQLLGTRRKSNILNHTLQWWWVLCHSAVSTVLTACITCNSVKYKGRRRKRRGYLICDLGHKSQLRRAW